MYFCATKRLLKELLLCAWEPEYFAKTELQCFAYIPCLHAQFMNFRSITCAVPYALYMAHVILRSTLFDPPAWTHFSFPPKTTVSGQRPPFPHCLPNWRLSCLRLHPQSYRCQISSCTANGRSPLQKAPARPAFSLPVKPTLPFFLSQSQPFSSLFSRDKIHHLFCSLSPSVYTNFIQPKNNEQKFF